MRTVVTGSVAGIVVFDRDPGVDLLPIVLAITCAFAAAVEWIRDRPRQP